ncbi:MAG: hypothetical protein AAGJ80_16545, partial [Cyanobacteria bacterium J06553_1]
MKVKSFIHSSFKIIAIDGAAPLPSQSESQLQTAAEGKRTHSSSFKIIAIELNESTISTNLDI